MTGRRAAPLQIAKTEIQAFGGEVGFTTMDVTDPVSVKSGVEAVVKQFGKIDIVIANAGKDNEVGKSES